MEETTRYRTPVRCSDTPKDRRSVPTRIQKPHTVAARLGHIHGIAQGKPYLARVDAGIQRLLRGATTQTREDEVPQQGITSRTELGIDGALKLAGSHRGSAQGQLGSDDLLLESGKVVGDDIREDLKTLEN